MLRALRSRNYRLFFIGQLISNTGTWMQGMALGWLVYRITDSSLALGKVAFCSQILAIPASPIAGAIADRFDRRRLVMVTQSLAMIQAFVLAYLTLTGRIQIWHIYTLAAFLGLISAFDIPLRQSFIVEMLDNREDLPNAIALNSVMFNGARILGPSTAGVLVFLVGEGQCFLFNALSYFAVLAALWAMRITPAVRSEAPSPMLRDIQEGMKYLAGSAPIRAVLLLVAFTSLVGFPLGALMPVFARDILHGDSRTQGFLTMSTGIGALLGALYLASRQGVRGLGAIMAIASAGYGLSLMCFSTSHYLPLSMALMTLAGFGMMVQLSACNTLVQTLVHDDKRGRIMSFYVMAQMGVMPFGSLLAGSMAHWLGAPIAVAFGGMGCIVIAARFASRLPGLEQAVHPVTVSDGRATGRAEAEPVLTQTQDIRL